LLSEVNYLGCMKMDACMGVWGGWVLEYTHAPLFNPFPHTHTTFSRTQNSNNPLIELN
jgi:hypothetical protein